MLRHKGYQNIFLTGATGVLGGYLVKELLRSTESTIFCLVRAGSEAEAKTRLRTFLHAYDATRGSDEEFDRRVHPLVGDVTHPHFGLTEARYRELVDTTDVTIHAAALTNLFLSLRRVEPINVGGTRHIIQFALQTRSKYLLYVSTYTVMGDKSFDPAVRFRESDYDIGQGFESMSYQQTKFTAEGMVREAAKEGLRYNIFRPGQIFGDSQNGLYPHGHANIVGLFYDIFKTVIETGVAFASEAHFDVVPVDYVAKGIISLGLFSEARSQTYHLTNPDIKTYSQVVDLLRELGYRITAVSQEEYRRRLFDREVLAGGVEYKSPTTFAFRWWFKREGFDFSRSAITECELTREALEGLGVRCAPLDRRLMATYIQAGIERSYFPVLPNTIFQGGADLDAEPALTL